MKATKRILAILLALLTLLPLAACGNANGGGSGNKGGEGVAGIPAGVNYEGYEFNVLLAGFPATTPNNFDYTDTSSVMDKAVYDRNTILEEQYGVAVKAKTMFGDEGMQAYNLVLSLNASGDYDYDLLVFNPYRASSLALDGYLYDLYKLPYLDLTQSFWDQSTARDLSIGGSLYMTDGDISTINATFTNTVIFNKDLYQQYYKDGQSMYEIVNNGDWTIDKLDELSKGVSDDLDGNGVYDENDLYGVMLWNDILPGVLNAGGVTIGRLNDEGNLELSLYSERAEDIVYKTVTLAYRDYAINFQSKKLNITTAQRNNIFKNNQALYFMITFLGVSQLRDDEVNYGILPFPKYDKAQAEYYTSVNNWHSSYICVPSMTEDPERTGTILQLLGYYSTDTIRKGYYEKTLVGRYVRDDESVGMLDLIYSTRIYDVGYIFRVASMHSQVLGLMTSNLPNGLATFYNAYKSKALDEVDKINYNIAELKASYADADTTK